MRNDQSSWVLRSPDHQIGDEGAQELADLCRVFGVVLPRTIILDLLQPLGHGREYAHDRVATHTQELNEGETVMAGELDADEHLLGLHVREDLQRRRTRHGQR